MEYIRQGEGLLACSWGWEGTCAVGTGAHPWGSAFPSPSFSLFFPLHGSEGL